MRRRQCCRWSGGLILRCLGFIRAHLLILRRGPSAAAGSRLARQ
jgi:hypothetical protein